MPTAHILSHKQNRLLPWDDSVGFYEEVSTIHLQAIGDPTVPTTNSRMKKTIKLEVMAAV
jgi:hypothetical protein